MPPKCVVRETPDEVASTAAELVAAQIHSVVEATGECLVALAGGSTPVQTYLRLRDLDIDWAKVHFVQTDERLVADRDARSAAVIESVLGLGSPANPAGWHPIHVASDGTSAAAAYAQRLTELRVDAAPDIAVLGLGTDGHTASLFEHNLNTAVGELVVPTVYQGEQRVSLGLDYLRSIPTRVLLATGQNKQRALELVLSSDAGRVRVPAAVVLGEDGYVIADVAATPERD
ncbi:6-phosphogluconolactonase [Nocardia nova]|uniref:6-phosphogluconolactonase n=1 Tax=Nocardia nova TaxID=37330 RepID=UPI0033DD55B9